GWATGPWRRKPAPGAAWRRRPRRSPSLAGQLRQAGVDYVCVTSGFVVRGARIPFGPGYL
ncbi:hypothetical protein, partial [Bordetella pertussis]